MKLFTRKERSQWKLEATRSSLRERKKIIFEHLAKRRVTFGREMCHMTDLNQSTVRKILLAMAGTFYKRLENKQINK